MTDKLTVFFSAIAFVSVPALILAAELFLTSRIVKLINRMAVQRLGGFLYLVLMWPGVVVHELSHAAACLVTRTKIVEVKLFSPHRTAGGDYILGYVRHVVPWSRTARLMIGTAPFFGGAVTLIVALNLIFPEAFLSFWQAVTAGGISGWGDLSVALGRWASGIPAGLADFGALQGLGVYLMVSVAAHVAPSRKDLEGSIMSLALVSFGACVTLGVLAVFSAEATWTMARIGRGFFMVMTAVMGLGLALVSAAALVVAVITFPLYLLGRSRQG